MSEKVVSFDLFDTILLRTGAHEISRYRKVSRTFADKTNRNTRDVFRSRINSWVQIYSQKKWSGIEASWTLLISGMRTQLNLSEEECILLNEIELAYEQNHLKVNAVVLEKILDYKNSGHKVIVISDMYLEKFQIEKILRHFQIWELFDEVFVSSSENFNKYDGSAFRTLENMGVVDFKNLRHYGDNLISDVHVPSSLGIESILIPRRFRKIYEVYGRKVNEYEMRKIWMM